MGQNRVNAAYGVSLLGGGEFGKRTRTWKQVLVKRPMMGQGAVKLMTPDNRHSFDASSIFKCAIEDGYCTASCQ